MMRLPIAAAITAMATTAFAEEAVYTSESFNFNTDEYTAAVDCVARAVESFTHSSATIQDGVVSAQGNNVSAVIIFEHFSNEANRVGSLHASFGDRNMVDMVYGNSPYFTVESGNGSHERIANALSALDVEIRACPA